MLTHVYFSTCPKKELFGEYIYHLLQQKGRFTNINLSLRKYIENAVGTNKPKLENFRMNLSLQDMNLIFDQHINSKLNKNKLDSFTLPSIISHNRFKNRSPLPIRHEKNPNSYFLIEDILTNGFPVVTKGGKTASLYVFYIGNIQDINIYQAFYQPKDNLSHFERIADINCSMLPERDYFNSLLFIIGISTIIAEIKGARREFQFNNLIVWKKAVMEGSYIEFSDLEFLLKLLGERPKDSELAYLLAYFFAIRNELRRMNKGNEEIIESLLDKLSYSLLVKKALDASVINQLSGISVDLWENSGMIKNINKEFIISFMEKTTDKGLSTYFDLGQELGKKIFGLCKGDKEEASKIIDRLAKELRNEQLPGTFAETLERNLIKLRDKGLVIDEDIGNKLKELSTELLVCDLSTFYLIKSAMIFGLISPSG